MAGAAIIHTRKALVETLNSLSNRDVVSLITYGSTVDAVIEAHRLDGLSNRNILIQQIEAEGGSAQYEALNVAAAQLRRFLNPDSINRILFLTDGQATIGPREDDDFIRLAESFAREGISVLSLPTKSAPFVEVIYSTFQTMEPWLIPSKRTLIPW